MAGINKTYPWQGKYDLAKDTPLHGNFGSFGIINLSELSEEGADNLFNGGFPYFTLKKEKPTKETTDK